MSSHPFHKRKKINQFGSRSREKRGGTAYHNIIGSRFTQSFLQRNKQRQIRQHQQRTMYNSCMNSANTMAMNWNFVKRPQRKCVSFTFLPKSTRNL